jgi:heat shock protein HslJ
LLFCVSLITSLGGEAPLPDTTITLTFGEDGTLNGSTGCNNFSTTYETEGNKISINEQASMTMMGCPDPVMAQEQGFLFAASMVRTFESNGEELVFKDADGKTLATFKAQ